MSASACFAASREGFAHVDLDTPLFFAEQPFEGGYAQLADQIDVSPIRSGHGVTPRGA
jgi:L-Ala-D/L-Glu epimerase